MEFWDSIVHAFCNLMGPLSSTSEEICRAVIHNAGRLGYMEYRPSWDISEIRNCFKGAVISINAHF